MEQTQSKSLFWKRVIEELDFHGKTQTWLAEKANIDSSTIGIGLKRSSCPQADIALRISKVLNVDLNYLINGTNESPNKIEYNIHRIDKYIPTINKLDALPEKPREHIIGFIRDYEPEYNGASY